MPASPVPAEDGSPGSPARPGPSGSRPVPSGSSAPLEPEGSGGGQRPSPGWLAAAKALPWRPVLLSFLAARAVVLAALALSQLIPDQDRRDGLLGWDAGWYLQIAEDGYQGLPPEGRRFFPLLPLLARALGLPLGGHPGAALLLLANAGAIAYALLAHRIALRVGLGKPVADRVPWVIAFAPAGFVLAMGYTEALFGVLVCVVLLGARSRRWGWVAAAGLLAGTLRPTGVVLIVPIVLEAARHLPEARPREWLARAVAAAAPAIGLAAYLVWAGRAFGDPLEPLLVHTDPGLRGGVLRNPLATLGEAVASLRAGMFFEAAPLLHLLWAGLAVTLLVLGWRRLPLSYTAFSAALLVLGLTAQGFTSFERYAASAVPLLLVGAQLLSTPRRRVLAMSVGAVTLAGYATLAFIHAYVP